MPRRKSKPAKVKSFALPLLVLSLLIATFGVYAYVRFRPVSPGQIFVVDAPQPLSEGQVTLTGTLIKDTPAGEPGTYLLTLSTGQVVTLDLTNADEILGQSLTISGYLTAPSEPGQPYQLSTN